MDAHFGNPLIFMTFPSEGRVLRGSMAQEPRQFVVGGGERLGVRAVGRPLPRRDRRFLPPTARGQLGRWEFNIIISES
jgi:hypothetical protein